MHEHLFTQAGTTTWGGPAQPEQAYPGPAAIDCTAALAGVIAATSDTRRLTGISAGLLAAVLAGTAAVSAALVVRGQPPALGSLGLLAPVLLSWLLAAALVLFCEGPVTGAFAELRRLTGAPVDPYAPWGSRGGAPLASSAVDWDYVVPLIAAARRQHERARVALSVAVLTTAGFLLWMVLSLAVAALA
jgi:hypothetical protein